MCGEFLVVGTNCGTINLFEINTLEFDGFIKNPSNIIQNSDNDNNSISAILQINESSIILTGNSIGHLILWDLKNFLEIRRIKSSLFLIKDSTLRTHNLNFGLQ
jgi:WD40 repeat protein